MRKALGKIQINKREDIDDRVAKSLEKEGFVVVLASETEINKEYLVLEDWKEETR